MNGGGEQLRILFARIQELKEQANLYQETSKVDRDLMSKLALKMEELKGLLAQQETTIKVQADRIDLYCSTIKNNSLLMADYERTIRNLRNQVRNLKETATHKVYHHSVQQGNRTVPAHKG